MIHPLYPDQLDRVMEIWLAGNLAAHPFISSAYWRDQAPAVRAAIAQAEVYVCQKQHQVLGFVGLSGSYIAGIFVCEEARRQGVGHQLMEYVKARHAALTLSVYQENLNAVHFYQREGFCLTGQGVDPATGQTELTMTWTRPSTGKLEFGG